MSDTLIKVEGVSKKFCRSLKKSLWYGMQDLGREITGRKHGGEGELRPDEFWAVNDVSFELKRGECLGLIGRNGAGKTTLLRMLNGLIKPDRGRIEMRGRVGALIALGAGFNPILTGRENIYVNASVLGLTKQEIDAKLDEIIDFAEIGEFINMPVQSYSSGMQMRLGFAIAKTLNPDILLLDEVIAVGDMRFRAKCHHEIKRLIKNTAVIFVSHNDHDLLQTCDQGIVLTCGKKNFHGEIIHSLATYHSGASDNDRLIVRDGSPVRVTLAYEPQRYLLQSETLNIALSLRWLVASSDIALVFFVLDRSGMAIAATDAQILEGHETLVDVAIPAHLFTKGIFKLGVSVYEQKQNSNAISQFTLFESIRNLTWFSVNPHQNAREFPTSAPMRLSCALTSGGEAKE
jgi:ABC-type polysaccharide/polyol phosphate transport system ATPase subunit